MNHTSISAIVVLTIIILLVYFFGRDTSGGPEQLEPLLAATGWSEKSIVDSRKEACKTYLTFSTSKEIVESLTPLEILREEDQPCDDSFHHNLSLFQRTCERDRCIGHDGQEYSRGEVETFYDICSTLDPCEKRPSAIVGTFQIDSGSLTNNNYCLNRNSETLVSACYMTRSQFFIVDYARYVATLPYYDFRKGNPYSIGTEENLSEAPLTLVRVRISGSNLALNEDGQFSNYVIEDNLGYNFLLNERIDFSPYVYFAPQFIKRTSFETLMNTEGRFLFAQNFFKYGINFEIQNSPTVENFIKSRFINYSVSVITPIVPTCPSRWRPEVFTRSQLRNRAKQYTDLNPDYVLEEFVNSLSNGTDRITCWCNGNRNSLCPPAGGIWYTDNRVLTWNSKTLENAVKNWNNPYSTNLETVIFYENKIQNSTFSACSSSGRAFGGQITKSPPCKYNTAIVSNLNFYNLL